jgi:peptidoglycan hydrolase-like protein with peptidoglycan-binding domain
VDDDYEFERSGLLPRMARLIGRHPRESVGLFVAAGAATAIIVNALFLQPGRHPAPLWAVKPRPVADEAVPRPRVVAPQPAPTAAPAETSARSRTDIIIEIQRALAQRGFYDGVVDGVWGAKTDAATRDFAQAAGIKSPLEANEDLLRLISKSNVRNARAAEAAPRTNDPIAALIAPSKQVIALQRALSDFGYGQIKPNGLFGPETQAAIEKFERDRKLPVTGQISDRLMREISAMTGRPLE